MTGTSQDFFKGYGVTPRDVKWVAAAAIISASGIGYLAGGTAAGFGAFLVFTMLLTAVIDLRVMLIPDFLSLPAIPVGLIAAMVMGHRDVVDVLQDHGVAALFAGGALFLIRAAYLRSRGIEGLGLGDVKLAATAGAWVGLEMLSITCLLATFGALAAVAIKSATSGDAMNMKTAVPFGSFIALAVLATWTAKVLLE